jgi:hypothetical protein
VQQCIGKWGGDVNLGSIRKRRQHNRYFPESSAGPGICVQRLV